MNIKRLDAASSTACDTVIPCCRGKDQKNKLKFEKVALPNLIHVRHMLAPVTLGMLIRDPIQQAKDGATAAADALRRISEACEQGMEWDGSRMDLLLFFFCDLGLKRLGDQHIGQVLPNSIDLRWREEFGHVDACCSTLHLASGINFRLNMKKQSFHRLP